MFSGEFKVALVNEVFKDDNADGLHDVIVSVIGESLSQEELRVFFYNLPEQIQLEALQWGLSDTQFREQVFCELEKQKERYEIDIKRSIKR